MAEASDNNSSGTGPPPEPSPSSPAALREDQIQNAVSFLSHPKVGSSGQGHGRPASLQAPVSGLRRGPDPCAMHPPAQVRSSAADQKRQFLQRKGLTEAEIDEAFRRVPEQPPGQALPATSAPAAAPTQGQMVPAGYVPAGQQQLVPAQQQPVRWSQVRQADGGCETGGRCRPGCPAHVPGGVVWEPAAATARISLPPTDTRPHPQALLGAAFVAAGVYALKVVAWPYVSEALQRWRASQSEEAEQRARQSNALAEAIQARGEGKRKGAFGPRSSVGRRGRAVAGRGVQRR